MRGYNPAYLLIAIIAITALSAQAGAAYWFQSGARGSDKAYYNTGASAQIETIAPQNLTIGSFGFWVGETISNNAFIQVGYVIPNQSGYYPTNCTVGPNDTATCAKGIYLSEGTPSWFWEYFPSSGNRTAFYGGYGPAGSAGKNGTFNTYSFQADGNTWNVYFNQQLIGSVDLGVPGSGGNAPEAIAEYADTNTNATFMKEVQFKNVQFRSGGQFLPMSAGYAYISYGKGSQTELKNLYGVAEVGQYVNNFKVGSNINVPPDSMQLWGLGYYLNVSSSVANTSSSGKYDAYSNVQLRMPRIANVSPGVREVFEGWRGSGSGSYTGNSTSITVSMYSNISETVIWQKQYMLNIISEYGSVLNVPGGTWYNAGSVARFSVNQTVLPISYGSRAMFEGWSTNESSANGMTAINGPTNVTAYWVTQYLVNATSVYGNTLGSGWYNANSLAAVSVDTLTIPINNESRMEFIGWSNGDGGALLNVLVSGPVFIHANYAEQYLVNFTATDAYGNAITPDYVVVSNQVIYGPSFLYGNTQYELQYAGFDGARMGVNRTFSISGPMSINSQLPVYKVNITTESWLGQPVNASINLTFSNGTVLRSYLGPTGNRQFGEVPYGSISGSMEYFFVTEKVDLRNGENLKLNFITPGAIGAIVVALFAIGLSIRALIKIEKEHENEASTKKK